MAVHNSVRTILRDRHYVECPRWHRDRVFLSDMYANEVLAVDPSGSAEVVAQVPGQPAGLGWLPDGRMLVVSMEQRTVLRREHDGELTTHADLTGHTAWDLNDMAVDSRGNAYVGGLGFDLHAYAPIADAPLFHISPSGTITEYGQGLRTTNGIAILPGEQTLVVAETFGSRLTAFDIAADGSLSNQRAWADFGGPDTDDLVAYVSSGAVTPDGICAGADNTVWMADVIARRAVRVREGGEIVETVEHDQLVIAPAVSGDGQTLFLCVAPSFDREERRAERKAELIAIDLRA